MASLVRHSMHIQYVSTDLYHVILDGMIIFPVTGVFADLGTMGVSMFFVSYVISLLWPTRFL
jgi:hypothetical protein